MSRLKLIFPYLILGGVIAVVAVSNMGADDEADVLAQMKTVCPPCGMDVDAATALSAEVDGHTYYFCSAKCREHFLRDEKAAAKRERLVDVVCHMEVNRAWGITAQYEGRTFHFCTDLCRRRFLAEPETYLKTRCMVCKKATQFLVGLVPGCFPRAGCGR